MDSVRCDTPALCRRTAPRGYVRRHGDAGELAAGLAQARTICLGKFTVARHRVASTAQSWFRSLKDNTAVAVASFLVVGGAIFNMFALVFYTFRLDPDMAFIYACFGAAAWVFAAAVFFFFLADPSPRHGKQR